MNRVRIFTFYNANNIGAFLQAYSLLKILEGMLPETEISFVKFGTNKKRESIIIKLLRNFRIGEIKKLLYKIKTASVYKEAQAIFPTALFDNRTEIDICVLGSDEIWNVASNKFEHHSQYFGHQLNSKNTIAYAPCAQGLTASQFRQYYPNEIFDDIDHLSARDHLTQLLVKEISGRDVPVVVDPTMLLVDFNYTLPPCPEKEEYILLYSYELEKAQSKKVIKFAKEIKLSIISVGTYSSWADKNVVTSPWLFLSYLKNAKFVVATTYHGTLLSIKYNKNFICFSSGNGKPNKKVEEVLNFYGLKSRDMIHKDSVNEAFREGIDYDPVNKIIEQSKNESLQYLKSSIGL